MALLAILVAIATFSALTTQRNEHALLQEKKDRLSRVIKLADMELARGFFAEYRAIQSRDATREVKMRSLEQLLDGLLRPVLSVYPGVLVGFVARGIDDGNPVYMFGSREGRAYASPFDPRPHEFLAGEEVRRQVFEVRHAVTTILGGGHRRFLMSVDPVLDGDKVVGAVWASEPVWDLDAQGQLTRQRAFLISLLAILIGGIGVILIVRSLLAGIRRLKDGLGVLQADLGFRFPAASGELSEVEMAINRMAARMQEMKEIEERARTNERLADLGRLIAGVAHEIRNPLTSIKGYLQYWAEKPGQAPSPESISVVLAEVQRLNGLLERLLYFARPASAKLAPTDLGELLGRTFALFESELAQQRIELVVDLPPNLPRVEADSEQLQQVLINLIINAIQAMPNGGRLTASVKHVGGQVEVRFTDTGTGITEEQLRQLFRPFYTTKAKGVGLGLAVSYEIVQAHHGTIGCDPRLGGGASFWVRLGALVEDGKSE